VDSPSCISFSILDSRRLGRVEGPLEIETAAVSAPHNSADSPVMRQYLEIKNRYPDSILMFRMGDFYEMFFEDAIIVGPVLDIAVTSRDKNAEDPVPMAGVPYHAIGGYLRTLVERGFKVAICEQMEKPEEARKRSKGPKIVRREVVRVVTPGALLDDEHLRSGESNFLIALRFSGEIGGAGSVAALDISSGEFIVVGCSSGIEIRGELARLAGREILAEPRFHAWISDELGPRCPRLEPAVDVSSAQERRVQELAAEGGETARIGDCEAISAAIVLAYAEATQPGQTLLLHRIRRHSTGAHLVLDETSLRNLEIFSTLREGKRKGSLLWSVDRTKTAMGARLLRAWLGAPLRDRAAIEGRLEAVEILLREARLRDELQSRLKDVRDVVRLTARARLQSISPREMGALRNSLAAVPGLVKLLDELRERRTDGALPRALEIGEDTLADVYEQLVSTLVDAPPANTREGGMIRDRADPFLAEQRELRDGGREALAAIETRERARTEINGLKVKHNRVFGYYLEIPRAHLSRVPKDYVRKQTLANAERFVTPELATLETKVLAAQEQILMREQELFVALRAVVSAAGERLMDLGEKLAVLDVLASFAEVAHSQDFVRPEVVDEPVLVIKEGRHPVVERMLSAGSFVPNDLDIVAQGGGAKSRLLVITGPNMGGKSTVMRQVALITILAHVGSFVPAVSARVGLVDRVFTRVGAADDLGRGESTFMVEMRETAQIVAEASPRSLVLLDEIGRGTATFDGLALAWAITEHLHDQVGCRTLFATHYHELCGLEARLVGVKNVHVAVHEGRGRIVFLHRLEAGAAGRSYGIQVGRLAGLPGRLLSRAGRILERLEAQDAGGGGPQLDLFAPSTASVETEAEVPTRADDAATEVVNSLRALDTDELSPRQAHELLCTLKASVE